MRLFLRVADGLRRLMPAELPLFVRISATDWAEGGWDIEQSVALAGRLREPGVDLIDVSSGGMVPRANIPVAKGYQVPFARRIRNETLIKTGAVGLITEVKQADEIITEGDADLVFLAARIPARTVLGPQSPARAGRGTDVAHPIRLRRQAPRAIG